MITMKRPYLSADFRARARMTLKRNLPTITMVYFLAMLPKLLSSAYASIQQRPLLDMVMNYATKYTSGEAFQLDVMIADLQALMPATLKLAWGLQLLAELVTPALMLGAIAAILKLMRGGSVSNQDVLGRIGCFFKGLLLAVLVAVKTFLWMLPGAAVSVLATVLLIGTKSVSISYFLMSLSSGLMLFLGLRAVLHYCLAECVLADDPSVGVMKAVRESISLMRYRKMQMVMLYVSFFLWILLANMITTMFSSMGPLYFVVNMVTTIALNLYWLASQCAFYDAYKGHPSTPQETVLVPFAVQQYPGGMGPQMPGSDAHDDDEQNDDDDDQLN